MLKFSMPTLLMLLLSSSAVFAGFREDLDSLLQSSANNEEKISGIIELIKKEGPETYSEKNTTLFMRLMTQSCFSQEEAVQLLQEVAQLEPSSSSSYVSSSTLNEPTFNEELGTLLYSSGDTEEKISRILELVKREDPTISYKEKVEALASYFFTDSPFPDPRKLFQEIICILAYS